MGLWAGRGEVPKIMNQSTDNPTTNSPRREPATIFRWHILNHLVSTYGLSEYLEIGYFYGRNFSEIRCASKTAVDPDPCQNEEQIQLPHGGCFIDEDPHSGHEHYIYKEYSDEFFQQLDKYCNDARFDLVFIDGAHDSSQVDRDLENSLRYLSTDGFVVLHDANPPLLEYTTTGIEGSWTGDVYRSIIRFRQRSQNYYCSTVDVDWGCAIITRHPRFLTKPLPNISRLNWQRAIDCWDEFSANRTELLALISFDEFVSTFR